MKGRGEPPGIPGGKQGPGEMRMDRARATERFMATQHPRTRLGQPDKRRLLAGHLLQLLSNAVQLSQNHGLPWRAGCGPAIGMEPSTFHCHACAAGL